MVVGVVGSIATTISSLTILPDNVRKLAAAIGLDFAKISTMFRKSPSIPIDGQKITSAELSDQIKPKPPTITILPLLLVALALSGCAGSFELMHARGAVGRSVGAAPHVDCRAIDSNRILWQGLAQGGAALAGTGGLSIIPIEDKDARIGVAITSVSAAAFTAIAAKLASDFGEEWVQKCQ
jgi:hypothetical protein